MKNLYLLIALAFSIAGCSAAAQPVADSLDVATAFAAVSGAASFPAGEHAVRASKERMAIGKRLFICMYPH